MCRQTMMLGLAIGAVGIGLLLGTLFSSTVVQVLLGSGLVILGFCLIRKA